MDSSAESEDWVQRRAPRACRLCRKKKVRCDARQPACSQCLDHKSECVYLPRAARARTKKRKESRHQASQRRHSTCSCGGSLASTDNTAPNAVATSLSQHAGPRTPDHSSTASGPNACESDNVETIHVASNDNQQESLDNCAPIVLQANVVGQLDDFHFDHGGGMQGLVGLHDSHNDLMEGVSPSMSLFVHSVPPHTSEFTDMLDPQLRDEDGFRPGPALALAADGSNGLDHPLQQPPEDEEGLSVDPEDDIGYSLQTALDGYMKYIGPSMSYFPATKLGQEWITEVTGSNYVSEQLDTFLRKWTPINPALHADQTYDFSILPSSDMALSYVDAYFTSVQCTFPILGRKEFLDQFTATYDTLMPSGEPMWCALVNVVLAIGCRASPIGSEAECCALFTNALSLLQKVILGLGCLRKVQTLTLMYVFLSHATSPQWGYTFLSCAVSESYALGLHVQPERSWQLSEEDISQRSLVFWSLFCLDSQLIVRLGRPPFLRRHVISLRPPSDPTLNRAFSSYQVHGAGGTPDAALLGRLFKRNIEISYLLLDVHDYALKGLNMADLVPCIRELETKIAKLEACTELQMLAGPGSFTAKLSAIPEATVLPVVTVFCGLMAASWIIRLRPIALKTVYQMKQFKLGIASLPSQPSPSLAQDLAIASEAAENLIKIVFAVPHRRPNCFWHILSLPVYAFYVLFVAVLHEPTGPKSTSHLELMSMVVESTVHGADLPHPLVSDIHLTHFLAFFSRAARLLVQGKRYQGL